MIRKIRKKIGKIKRKRQVRAPLPGPVKAKWGGSMGTTPTVVEIA